MKKVLFMCLVILSIFSVISCQKDKQVNVEWWTLETQSDRQEKIKILIEVYEATHPNVKVNLVPVNEPDLASLVAAAAASGTLPDIIKGPSQLALSFNEEGIIDTNIATDVVKTIGEDKFYQGTLDTYKYENSYFGVPFHFFIQGIWYRTDWFEEAGLPAPNTLENILKAAKYFYKPEQNQYGVLVGTQPELFTEQVYTQLALANGAYEIAEDGSLQFGDEATKKAFSYYKELAQYNPPGPQTWRARDYYLQGKLAMFFYSSYIMDDLSIQEAAESSLTGDNFEDLSGASFDPQLVNNTGIVTNIVGTQGSSYGEISALLPIKKDGRSDAQKEAVESLLSFLLEESNYIPYLHMAPGGMLPVLKDTVKDENFYNDQKQVYSKYSEEQILSLVDGLNSLQSFSVRNGTIYPASGQITAKNIIPRAIFDVTINNKDIDAAINEAKEEMSEFFEK